MKVRLTKEFRFEMAHALLGHDGPCAHLHGHSYVLTVTVIGTPSNRPGHPKDGMLMDLSDLKKLVEQAVVSRLDHATVINERTSESDIPSGVRVLRVPFQPTCENLLGQMVGNIRPLLPQGMHLCSIRLDETATSWAEWRAEDQD